MGEIREEVAHHRQKVGNWVLKWAFGSHPKKWFWHRSAGRNWTLRIPRLWVSGVFVGFTEDE